MLLRLCSWLISGIAILYVLEFTGIIQEREYFPSLPRLEANASDPSRWFEAAHWGITHSASWVRCASQDGGLTAGCNTKDTETATSPEPAAGPEQKQLNVVNHSTAESQPAQAQTIQQANAQAEPAPAEFDPTTDPTIRRMEEEVKAHQPITTGQVTPNAS